MIRFMFGRHGISTNTIYEHRTPSTKRTLEDANPVVHAEDRAEHWALKLTGYDDEDDGDDDDAGDGDDNDHDRDDDDEDDDVLAQCAVF